MHAAMMADLRHRILPPTFLSKYPKEAGFCLWLLHPEPTSRPTARYLAECYSEMNYVGEYLLGMVQRKMCGLWTFHFITLNSRLYDLFGRYLQFYSMFFFILFF